MKLESFKMLEIMSTDLMKQSSLLTLSNKTIMGIRALCSITTSGILFTRKMEFSILLIKMLLFRMEG